MTNITIQNGSEMQAIGQKRSKNAVPVLCITTGEIFTSVTDAAKHLGVNTGDISHMLNGRQKTCKGMQFCRVSEVTEHLNEITAHMKAETKVSETKTASKVAAPKVHRKTLAERFNEARQRHKINKANKKLERCKNIVARIEEKLKHAMDRALDAHTAVNALTAREV